MGSARGDSGLSGCGRLLGLGDFGGVRFAALCRRDHRAGGVVTRREPVSAARTRTVRFKSGTPVYYLGGSYLRLVPLCGAGPPKSSKSSRMDVTSSREATPQTTTIQSHSGSMIRVSRETTRNQGTCPGTGRAGAWQRMPKDAKGCQRRFGRIKTSFLGGVEGPGVMAMHWALERRRGCVCLCSVQLGGWSWYECDCKWCRRC